MTKEHAGSELVDSKKITVEQAAKIMGVTPRFLQLGLQRKEFPFGVAIKPDKRWTYYINAERFRIWMTGEEMKELYNTAQNEETKSDVQWSTSNSKKRAKPSQIET